MHRLNQLKAIKTQFRAFCAFSKRAVNLAGLLHSGGQGVQPPPARPLRHHQHPAPPSPPGLPRLVRSVWSTLIGRAPTLLRSHWSRAFLVMLAPNSVSCHKEPSRQNLLLGALDALLAGSLWHETAGVETHRNFPRHRGGPVCVRVSPLPDGQHALEGRGRPGLPRVPLRGHGRDERRGGGRLLGQLECQPGCWTSGPDL